MKDSFNNTPRRAHALDALRGYAIATMILAAMEAWHILPAWMYHAQVPPPDHVFSPNIYGITWVDLIFPFFLFSMGAAIPLSLGRQFEKGVSRWKLAWKSVQRGLKLAFFAIFIMHAFPYMLGYQQDWLRYTIPMVAFVLLCLMFIPNPFHLPKYGEMAVKWGAYIAATALMLLQPYADGATFRLADSDIIMLILSNIAVTGAVIYLLTIRQPLARIAVIPIITAIFMSGHTDGAWTTELLKFSPAPWLFQIPYQEYLLIIIPGTVAGEWIREWLKEEKRESNFSNAWLVALLALAIIVCNVIFLFSRDLIINLLNTIILSAALGWILRNSKNGNTYWQKLWRGGSYLLLLGLCLEAYEGGIRKDDVTLSYLFVTCGMAFLALLFFSVICDHYHVKWITYPLEQVGKNPMVAYVSNTLVVIPFLMLTQLYPLLESVTQLPLLGFIRGIILTSLCMALTSWFTYKKYFWKT